MRSIITTSTGSLQIAAQSQLLQRCEDRRRVRRLFRGGGRSSRFNAPKAWLPLYGKRNSPGLGRFSVGVGAEPVRVNSFPIANLSPRSVEDPLVVGLADFFAGLRRERIPQGPVYFEDSCVSGFGLWRDLVGGFGKEGPVIRVGRGSSGGLACQLRSGWCGWGCLLRPRSLLRGTGSGTAAEGPDEASAPRLVELSIGLSFSLASIAARRA